MLVITRIGHFERSKNMLVRSLNMDVRKILNDYGKQGVEALASATPKKTGKTAASWSYEISKTSTGWTVTWNNSNINKGVNIAIIIQYGHGTGTGAYVQGIDYINPAIRPVFENMASEVWREVGSSS